MLGPDLRDLVGVRRDEPAAAWASRNGCKSGPADAGAPECGDPSVEHHIWSIAGAIEIDGFEILVLLQPETVEHIARQNWKPRAARAKGNRLADEVADAPVGTVGAHHEHPGTGIHRGEDF